MPTDEKAPQAAERLTDLDRTMIVRFWKTVARCLRDVFKLDDREARLATSRMQTEVERLPAATALMFYHDSPLQVASILAGASDHPLTAQELIDYDDLCGGKDRPSRDEILDVHGIASKPA